MVIGAGLTGLLAAKVLTEAFTWVTVLEREQVTGGADALDRLPDGRRVCVLAPLFGDLVEQLLPGFMDLLRAQGAAAGDILSDVRWYLGGQPLRQRETGLTGLSVSQAFLEGVLRRVLLQCPGVGIVDSCDVTGLMATADGRRVTGVRVHPCGEREQGVDADLVVDASGEASHLAWLTRLGVAPPRPDTVHLGVSEVVRRYRLPVGVLEGDLAVVVAPTCAVPRSGCLVREERGRWALSLGSLVGDLPRLGDDRSLLRFAGGLAAGDIREVLGEAEPLGEPAFPYVSGRVCFRYGSARGLPSGLLLMGLGCVHGDLVGSRAATVAALEALVLREFLGAGGTVSGYRFHHRAWRLRDRIFARTHAYIPRFSVTLRHLPLSLRLRHRLLDRVVQAAVCDAEAALRLLGAYGLVRW
ncbi:NAD(P)-binding protein [Streptomyces rubradiris]|uniref:NAD(P)-binding protein n=1 Tax=Streptomyces rubradiris TaxID=285531 RepID=UPI0016748F2E|nr:FAD-binding monooxygenase [Streptomyces rubradiris]